MISCEYLVFDSGLLIESCEFNTNIDLINSMLNARPYFCSLGGTMSVKRHGNKILQITGSMGNLTKIYKFRYLGGNKR